MSISRKQVLHIAKLARLELTEREVEKFTGQLSQILEHAASISELDIEDVKPLTHAVDRKNVFRKDKVEKGLTKEEALLNAPSSEDNAFKIPPII